MDHFLLESEVSLPGPSQPTPVTVYKHRVTSMRFVFVDITGPQATATIIVPTVVKDSRGLPHTLEHCKELKQTTYSPSIDLDINLLGCDIYMPDSSMR